MKWLIIENKGILTNNTTSGINSEITIGSVVSDSSLSSSFEFPNGSLSRLTFGTTIETFVYSTKSVSFSEISIGSTLGSTSFINSN